MELWLTGLGIEVIWSRLCIPEDNGIVERSHRTMQSWTAPGYCRDVEHLQQSLDQNTTLQREVYPNRSGQTRLARYPQLLDCPRPYQAQQEPQLWSLSQAQRPLVGRQWLRKVSANGQISLYNRNYLVGRDYAKQSLWVRFDPETSEWICLNDEAKEVKRLPSLEINPEVIRHLLVHRPNALRPKPSPSPKSENL
jgi:hypothetical protein